ncbi:MAG: thiamine phosphate synthase [Pseudohongiellaceae bacterium]
MKPLHGVYAITDPVLMPDDDSLLSAVEQTLLGGAALIQYRNKPAHPAVRERQATALLSLCASFGTPLLINDDVELCLRIGAAGVHLGQQDNSLAEARDRLGPDAIIGISCHARESLALEAQRKGASYVAMGRFFPSQTKPEAPASSLDDLRRIRPRLHVPLVAIGGVNAENGASLVHAGADMLAAIHHLFSTTRIQQRTREMNRLFQRTT